MYTTDDTSDKYINSSCVHGHIKVFWVNRGSCTQLTTHPILRF